MYHLFSSTKQRKEVILLLPNRWENWGRESTCLAQDYATHQAGDGLSFELRRRGSRGNGLNPDCCVSFSPVCNWHIRYRSLDQERKPRSADHQKHRVHFMLPQVLQGPTGFLCSFNLSHCRAVFKWKNCKWQHKVYSRPGTKICTSPDDTAVSQIKGIQ